MRLSALISALPTDLAACAADALGANDPVIGGVAYDSRQIAPGDAFFALRGADVDGHDYLQQALKLGAAALFVEVAPSPPELAARAVVVTDTRRALAPASAHFYGHPSREVVLVGVTGTNGKTSTTYLLESILAGAGRRVGLIGTVEVRYADVSRPALNTTPESLDLQRTLREMCTRGIDTVVMEVSSHGLELGRVDGCRFGVAAFTNLTQDHLDFHGDMDAYRASKVRLFEHYLAPDARAVVNLADPSAAAFEHAARSAGAELIRVSRDASDDVDVALVSAEISLSGTRACVRLRDQTLEISVPLLGDFNVENMLVACGAALAAGVTPEAIAAGIARCPQVPGRVERVGSGIANAPTVLVDYAHTPDAVEKLLATLRPLAPGRLIAVFGCGGDRDRSKRPLMAEAVARHADRVLATSDNPRTEDPEKILDDVERGLTALQSVAPEALAGAEHGYARIADRREAIVLAIAIACPGDTVVIAGKGHEDYQIVGRERLPFSDCDEALRALHARGAA